MRNWNGCLAATSKKLVMACRIWSNDALPKPLPRSSSPELRRMAAERGDGLACAVSDLDVADARSALAETLLRDGLQKALGGLAPEVVEHNVDARPANSARKAETTAAGSWSSLDDCVGAEALQLLERAAAGGDDAPRPEMLRDLNRQAARRHRWRRG